LCYVICFNRCTTNLTNIGEHDNGKVGNVIVVQPGQTGTIDEPTTGVELLPPPQRHEVDVHVGTPGRRLSTD
jgi:hypothetical protein